ncbi:MAG: BatA and WFA domain-containing protein [Planctomycetaceae bacterium]|nr:BatA and WFA domain-containing protein [Planctomycetaceae bacterium]
MTVANPIAWGLLLLAVPIILFFLLKIRFRKESVATAIFWQQVFEERRNRRLHRRLRHLISLLLALLFLACLTAAVLDPALSEPTNIRHIIIIDNSASMNALLDDSKTTRLELAKRQAHKQLNHLSGQHVAILTASINPVIVSGFTDQIAMLRRALAEIPSTDFPGDLPAALHLAEQLRADSPDSMLYIYTGGPPFDNLAITRFQPRRLPEHVADYEIFVEVVNFGTQTIHTRLEIERNDELIHVITLALEPNLPTTRIIRNTSSAGGLFRARLTDGDPFPTDNTAIAFLSEQYVQRILLYGQENFFLWHALQSLPMTEVAVIDSIPEYIPPDSVLLLHRSVPEILPSGNVLLIDPQDDCDFFQVAGRLDWPIAANVDTESPLVRFLSPGLMFANARVMISRQGDPRILIETAEGFPLYLQFTAENRQVLVLSADLNQGDFALRTAFPLLISQALASFRNSEELLKAYSTAEAATMSLPTVGQSIILRSPSGREEVFPSRDGLVSLGRLGEVGIWTILELESGRELARIACNLFSASESNFLLDGEPMQVEIAVGRWFAWPIWFYLACLALLLTVVEWFLYQRRWID